MVLFEMRVQKRKKNEGGWVWQQFDTAYKTSLTFLYHNIVDRDVLLLLYTHSLPFTNVLWVLNETTISWTPPRSTICILITLCIKLYYMTSLCGPSCCCVYIAGMDIKLPYTHTQNCLSVILISNVASVTIIIII